MGKPQGIERYPGPRPFDEREKDLFFGRNEDIDEIIQSIRVYNIYLIHGESGLGKSSLINAGLIPQLKEKGFAPVLVRVKERTTSLKKNVMHQVLSTLNISGFDVRTMESLWATIKICNGKDLYPVLIFDQFEQFAYQSPTARRELIQEIADLFKENIPESAGHDIEWLKKEAIDISWYSPPQVKVIFSLRSDRLAVLEEIAVKLPAIVRNRYRVKPLSRDQAEVTIVLPGLMESIGPVKFKTDPFKYNPSLVDTILDVVRDKRTGKIETTHLQMICQEIEYLADKKPDSDREVTENDLNGRKGIEDLIRNYYRKQLEKIQTTEGISNDDYTAMRILIEKRLVEQNKRVLLAEESVYQFFRDYFLGRRKRANREVNVMDVTGNNDAPESVDQRIKEFIDLLLSLRIIRDQSYDNNTFYEISHDTLVPPIVEEMGKREKEEQARLDDEERRKQKLEAVRQKKIIDDINAKNKEIEKQRKIAVEALKASDTDKQKAIDAQRMAEFEQANAVQAKQLAERERERASLAEQQALSNLTKVQRLRRTNFLIFIVVFGLTASISIFLFAQNASIKESRRKIARQIAQICSYEGQINYEKGNQMLARALWVNANNVDPGDTISIFRIKNNVFAPFSGAEIRFVGDNHMVATRYMNNELVLWQVNENPGTGYYIDTVFSAPGVRSFKFSPTADFLVYETLSSALVAVNLKTHDRDSLFKQVDGKSERRIYDYTFLPKANVLAVKADDSTPSLFFKIPFPVVQHNDKFKFDRILESWVMQRTQETDGNRGFFAYVRNSGFKVFDFDERAIIIQHGDNIWLVDKNREETINKIEIPDQHYLLSLDGRKVVFSSENKYIIKNVSTGETTALKIPRRSGREQIFLDAWDTRFCISEYTQSGERLSYYDVVTQKLLHVFKIPTGDRLLIKNNHLVEIDSSAVTVTDLIDFKLRLASKYDRYYEFQDSMLAIVTGDTTATFNLTTGEKSIIKGVPVNQRIVEINKTFITYGGPFRESVSAYFRDTLQNSPEKLKLFFKPYTDRVLDKMNVVIDKDHL